MNKFLSLLIAVFFFSGIIFLIAGALWYMEEPSSTASNSLIQSDKPDVFLPAPNAENQSGSFNESANRHPGFVLVCQIEAPDGTPVEHASVELVSSEGSSYRNVSSTDSSGLCRMLILQTGTYRIVARAEGYSPTDDLVTITLASDREQTRTLTLRSPAYTLKGWVMTHSNIPVQDATVTYIDSSNPNNNGITRTRRNGIFNLENLTPGNYAVSAFQDGYLESHLNVSVRHNQQIVLRLDRQARLNGMVLDDWRRPIEGATVSVSLAEYKENPINTAVTQANGRFALFGLPAQKLTLCVEERGFQSVQRPIEITRSIHDVELTVHANPIILQGKTIDAQSRQGIPGLPLEVWDWPITAAFPRKVSDTQTGIDGEFSFSGLLPANYEIRYASPNSSNYSPDSQRVPISFTDITNCIFELHANASVSGSIVDESGVPIPNANVRVIHTGSQSQTVVSNREGRYKISVSTSAGKESNDETITIAAKHPDYAESYSEPLPIAPGASIENINLTVTPGFTIQGSVRNNQYRPIADALVSVQLLDESLERIVSRTDSDGAYIFNHIPLSLPALSNNGIAQVTLSVQASGYEYQTRAIPLDRDKKRNDVFILRPSKMLAGSVVLPDGTPAIGATVTLYGDQTQVTETGNGGSFLFASTPEKDTQPILVRFGQSRYRYPQNLPTEKDYFGSGSYFTTIAPDQSYNPTKPILLQPENGIVGRVYDGENHAPIARFSAILEYGFPQYGQYRIWSERDGIWDDPSPGQYSISAPLPGDYRFTIRADGFIPAIQEIHFYDPPQVKTLDVRLTRTGNGAAYGVVGPYRQRGNIQRLLLAGSGMDRPLAISTDPQFTGPGFGLFQVDNIPPGEYDLFVIYHNREGGEARQSISQFEAVANRSANLGLLDLSSIYLEP